MTRGETVVREDREYRGHYIRVEIDAHPPLPHDDGDDGGMRKLIVAAEVYDGRPIDDTYSVGLGTFGNSGLGADMIYRNTEDPDPDELRETVRLAVEKAKARVDERVGQRDIVVSEAEIAINDTLGAPDDEHDTFQGFGVESTERRCGGDDDTDD